MDNIQQRLNELTGAVNLLFQRRPNIPAAAAAQIQEQLTTVMEEVQQLIQGASALPVTIARHQTEPKIPLPDSFTGERQEFLNFRDSCLLYFQLRPMASGTLRQKIGIVMSLLRGDPQRWAFNLPQDHTALSSVDAFFEAMAVIYDDPDRTRTAETNLEHIQQGRRPAEEYAAEFRRWAAFTTWGDAALRHRFRLGLSDAVRDLLLALPTPFSLEMAISQAIDADRRIRERRVERSSRFSSSRPHPGPLKSAEEPMEVGSSHLTQAERARRQQKGLCLFCGKSGHLVKTCPLLPAGNE